MDEVRPVRNDIADPDPVKTAFDRDPGIVFHLVAFFANQNSVEHTHEDIQTDGHGIIRLLEQCENISTIDRFVNASSSCVYDNDINELPFTEYPSVSMEFDTPYEITKTLGEAYCTYFQDRGVSTARGRIFNSYGPSEVLGRYRNVIPKFLYLAHKEEQLPITGSGEETRDFTFVNDIVDGLLRLGWAPEADGRVFNLASGTETKIQELAEIINDVTGNPAGIEYRDRREWDTTKRRLGNVDRASEELGYDPSVSLRSGLERTNEWFERHWERIEELTTVDELR